MLSNDQVRYVKTAFCKQKSKTNKHFHYQIFHIFQTINIQYGTFIHRAGGGRVLSGLFKPPPPANKRKQLSPSTKDHGIYELIIMRLKNAGTYISLFFISYE